jgi:hypothetical protein
MACGARRCSWWTNRGVKKGPNADIGITGPAFSCCLVERSTVIRLRREAIVEVFYRGSSMTQAATALGIPAGTVKSRMYYGLKALRLVLQERGITP